MFEPKITFKEIEDESIASNNKYPNGVIEYLRNFIEYLKKVPLKSNSIKMYVNRILVKFLNNGFSLKDLLGSLKDGIRDYSPGGKQYDAKDHCNTLSALKHLRRFYWQGKLPEYISISNSSGWQSFANNHNDHTVFYMENNKVFSPKKQKMSDYDFYCIQELIFDNAKYLSPGNGALTTIHGPSSYYSYVVGKSSYDMDALRGERCQNIFFTKEAVEKPYVDRINKVLLEIINKYR